MTRRGLRPVIGAALLLAALAGAGRGGEPEQCPVSPEILGAPVGLPNLARAIGMKQPVRIVVIGGGSTKGTAAGPPERAYPQRFQAALRTLYPEVPITVTNHGLPRQTARQMLARFPELSDDEPALIVWEVGITDAVRGIDLDEFASTLQAGIDLAKNRAIDLVLVDMQFSRRATGMIDFERYLNTITRIGDINDIYVFPRFAIMRQWSEDNVFDYEDVPMGERAQLAARVYDCIGRALAQAIGNAVR